MVRHILPPDLGLLFIFYLFVYVSVPHFVAVLDHVALSLEVVGDHTTSRSDHLTSVYAAPLLAVVRPDQADLRV